MKTIRIVALLGVLGVSLLVPFTSWGQAGTTDQGLDAVEVVKVTATVEKVDLEHRKVTLILEDGKKKTYKVDKSVQNLDEVQAGDHLKISYTEEIMILAGKTNETPAAFTAGGVGLAPRGAKPEMVMADTSVISVKILAINAQTRRVTYQDPDGKKKSIKVSKNFQNLDRLQIGDIVDMGIAESLVVEIVKP